MVAKGPGNGAVYQLVLWEADRRESASGFSVTKYAEFFWFPGRKKHFTVKCVCV